MSNIIEIDCTNLKELAVFKSLNDRELLHYNEPGSGLFLVETPMLIERALKLGYEPVSFLAEKKELDKTLKDVLTLAGETPVYTADVSVLQEISGFRLTRGLVCAMKRKPLPSAAEICKNARRVVVLDDVVNPLNVGAIFRSAAALNMDAILLTPECADPLYRRSVRTGMATVFQIPWTFIGHDENALLHQLGFKTVAMALKENSLRIDDETMLKEEKLAIIMGNEGYGLKEETIDACDYTVMIPMTHGVDSLNVAAASAIAFFELGK